MERNNMSRRTLLCLTADTDVRDDIAEMLYRHYSEHKLVFAPNGVEGVTFIEKLKPDIFIVDSDMPADDYTLVLDKISAFNKTNKSITFTTCHDEGVVGLSYYITKPINFEIFRVKLDRAIKTLDESSPDIFHNAKAAFFK